MRRRTLAIAVAALGAVGLAAGAFAATQTNGGPQQTFVNDVAGRLHVTPARLTAAVKQALIDQINAAVRAGHLPRTAANTIKQRIEHSNGIPFGPPMFFGPSFRFGKVPPGLGPPGPLGGHLFMHPPVFLAPALVAAASTYLGLTHAKLFQQLRSGKTLAQIAHARGKTPGGLVRAITGSIKARLSRGGHGRGLPGAIKQRLEQSLNRRIQAIVTGRLPFGPPGLPGRFYMPPGQRPQFRGGAFLLPPTLHRWTAYAPAHG